MSTIDKNIIAAEIPLSFNETSRHQFELFLIRLDDAIAAFETAENRSRPTIYVHLEKSKAGTLEFHGKGWVTGGQDDEEYAKLARLVTEAVNAFEAAASEFHVNVQVHSAGRATTEMRSKVGIFLRKVRPSVSTSPSKEGAVYRLLLPLWSFDDVVLPTDTWRDIQRALVLIQFEHLVYEEWCMKSVDPFPSCALNFYGPSGTGKTMAAHVVAQQLGRRLLALNIAEIESKFVGESPKNLVGAFRLAESTGAVLFFDEADSILGKRIVDVSQGSEQAINSLRSQMLVSLDSFRGVVIFATNLIASYDFAFRNRISHIQFNLPGIEERIGIWQRHLPPSLPLDLEIGLQGLAGISEGFSGRDIKNSVMIAIGEALANGRTTLSDDDLINAIHVINERRNLGQAPGY